MRKRKNADDTLRRAERAFLQEPSKENTLRYWRACLQAGILPKPSAIGPDGRQVWSLDENYVERQRTGFGATQLIDDRVYWAFSKERGHTIGGPPKFSRLYEYARSDIEAERLVKKAISALIDFYETKENPRKRRKNADGALRAAYRAYQQDKSNTENTARYWRECLRADELPEPSIQINVGLAVPDRWWYLGEYHTARVSCVDFGAEGHPLWRVTVVSHGELVERTIVGSNREQKIKEGLRYLLEDHGY